MQNRLQMPPGFIAFLLHFFKSSQHINEVDFARIILLATNDALQHLFSFRQLSVECQLNYFLLCGFDIDDGAIMLRSILVCVCI